MLPSPAPLYTQEAKCFWESRSITSKEQVNLVRLCHRLAVMYLVASFSLPLDSRPGMKPEISDMKRIIAMAAILAIADKIIRLQASDRYSLVSRVIID